jgi:hypothetical protein
MRYKYDFTKVMKRSVKMLCSSHLIANVEKSESAYEVGLTIQLSAEGALQRDRVLEFAQRTLLNEAIPSKSIYILGYASSSAFLRTLFGFDVRYVAMGNAATACWHLFKKCSCRHGESCRKQHEVWTMRVRVFIEAATSEAQKSCDCPDMKTEF